MLPLLVVGLLVSGLVAKDAEHAKMAAMPAADSLAEAAARTVTKDSESAEIRVPLRNQFDDDHNDDRLYLKAKLDGRQPSGPIVARNLHSTNGHGPNIAAQDEIIKFTYSPAYYEPIWVLDYRFLKSGGRRYTRGPGGQILILPKSYRHHKGDDTHDYDSMIEHLRLKLIAEQNARAREHGFGAEPGQGRYEQGRERGDGYEGRERGNSYEGRERGNGYDGRERGNAYEQQQGRGRGNGYEQEQDRRFGYEEQRERNNLNQYYH